MSILRKRRRKSRLIEELSEPKSGKKDKKSSDSNGNLYLEQMKKFQNNTIASTLLLFLLWWIPLLGPMLAGYLTGRLVGKRWLALKVIAIPTIFICVIVNLVSIGILPTIDLGREIGVFFRYISPGIYYALAPGIGSLIVGFNMAHLLMGIGSNGYLIIAIIMAYMGGLICERRDAPTAMHTKKKTDSTESSDDDKFLYRKKNDSSDTFSDVAGKLKKLGTPQHSMKRSVATLDIPISKSKNGWVRKEPTSTVNADVDITIPEKNEDIRPTARYTMRHTVNMPDMHSAKRTVDNHKRTESRSGHHTKDDTENGFDMVSRSSYPQKPAMSRAIIDRAVKTYNTETRERSQTSKAGVETPCQMGNTHKREWDSL